MKAVRDKDLCKNCNYCKVAIACSGEENCIACGSCVEACPYSARRLVNDDNVLKTISCMINNQWMDVPSHQSVLKVLESFGFRSTFYPEDGSIFAPCRTGGCF